MRLMILLVSLLALALPGFTQCPGGNCPLRGFPAVSAEELWAGKPEADKVAYSAARKRVLAGETLFIACGCYTNAPLNAVYIPFGIPGVKNDIYECWAEGGVPLMKPIPETDPRLKWELKVGPGFLTGKPKTIPLKAEESKWENLYGRVSKGQVVYIVVGEVTDASFGSDDLKGVNVIEWFETAPVPPGTYKCYREDGVNKMKKLGK